MGFSKVIVPALEARSRAARSVFPLALLLVNWPSVLWYLSRMSDGSDEPWGVLALLLGGVFAWRGRDQELGPARYFAASFLLLVPVLLGVWSTPLLTSFFVVSALACLLVDKRCWVGQAGLFALALPLISSLQFYGGFPLRWLVGFLSAGVLRLLGFGVEARGAVMHWRGEMIVIDAPCSGVQMLWGAAFLACAMICIQKMGLRDSILTLQVASVSSFFGNVLRNVLLFFVESGLVDWPAWSHDMIGLGVFAVVLLFVVCFGSRRLGRPERVVEVGASRCGLGLPRFVLLAVFCVLLVLNGGERGGFPERENSVGEVVQDLRKRLVGEGWRRVALADSTLEYAARFPGAIELFEMEGRTLVVRVIYRATRRYHQSADCYRALGYSTSPLPILMEVDGAMWGRVLATREGERVEVRERVVSSDGQSWTDASSWFWAAALGKSEGPWVGYSESLKL